MIIHQPARYHFGDILIEQLNKNGYTTFRFLVAYAKMSGVNRLLPYIKKFRESGHRVEGVVGIDQKNTSYEALSTLFAETDKLWIYHSSKTMLTFHPKVYSFAGDDEQWFAVGSNNLTAGGMFNNYETAYCSNCPSERDSEELSDLFAFYTNEESPCCKVATAELIELLLQERYIDTEKHQIMELVRSIKQTRRTTPRTHIFSSDKNLPFSAAPQQERAKKATVPVDAQHEPISDDDYVVNDAAYLIRFIPRAGNRSKQVHFTMDIMDSFFKLPAHSNLKMQYIDFQGRVFEFEERVIVFAQRNRNVKVELAQAASLNDNYPEDPSKRPVLVMKRVGEREFLYTILLDGNGGYTALNRHLSAKQGGRSLPYDCIGEEAMYSLWPECPLL